METTLFQNYDVARDTQEAVQLQYNNLRASILEDVQDRLDALDAEFLPLIEQAAAKVAAAETELKDAVKVDGQSVKCGRWHVVYTAGRRSVDMKAFDGYAVAHPEVNQLVKIGEPSVSIRMTK